MEIKKVWERKDGVKFVIIPKNSEIQGGDYVSIDKIENGRGKEKDRFTKDI